MKGPLVSIITITRNRGNLLHRCILSVMSQTYSNIEHIIVDGASTDNTDDVIAEFNDKRLKYYKLDYNWPDKETDEFAISKCSGKYVTFLDSDDEYQLTKIEKQVRLIESLPEDYGFVYCWMSYFDSSKNNAFDHIHKTQLRGNVKDEVIGEPTLSGTPTLMFRMAFFRSIGGWKSMEEIGIASDWEMCARACQLTKVDYVPESLVNVYVNHGSVRQSDSKKYYNDTLLRQIKFHQYFLSNFAENFKRRPELAFYHYYCIALNYFHLKRYLFCVKYMIKSIYSNPKAFFYKLIKR